jgi:predicted nucleic acid-binding protein
MALYMLDTDTVMCLIRGKTPALDERIAAARPPELCISAVTRGELLCGLSRQESRAAASDDAASSGREALANCPRPQRSYLDRATLESLRSTTHASLAKLTPSEARALRKRFGIKLETPHTLEEVGKQFDLARERTRQSSMHRLSDLIDEFLARVQCLPWDEAAATHFAALAARLQPVGRALGSMDMMIAGHAIAAGAVLVSTRETQFAGVDGLRVEDWTECH